jgi:tRNA G18 (ribose-2'-O)-methylase SpoU
MRGYFGIGVEGISKVMNLGALFRSAHAFGASFAFTVAASYSKTAADTTDVVANLPFYDFPDLGGMRLPQGCALVGVELLDDATELPSFRHPRQAAYVLGSEREGLSPGMVALCDFVVRIPMRFSVNLSVAGALVMYDRLISLGRHAPRPVAAGGPTEALPAPVFGPPIYQRKRRRRAAQAAVKASAQT